MLYKNSDVGRSACETSPGPIWSGLRLADVLADGGKDLSERLKLADKANRVAPDNRDVRFLLARLFTLDGRWPEASKILEELASRESTEFSARFFKTAIETGHLDDAIAILERTGAQDWWRPLYEAPRGEGGNSGPAPHRGAGNPRRGDGDSARDRSRPVCGTVSFARSSAGRRCHAGADGCYRWKPAVGGAVEVGRAYATVGEASRIMTPFANRVA